MSDLKSLKARVDAAVMPDRDLDVAIFCAIQPLASYEANPRRATHPGYVSVDYVRANSKTVGTFKTRRYTASIEDALHLASSNGVRPVYALAPVVVNSHNADATPDRLARLVISALIAALSSSTGDQL